MQVGYFCFKGFMFTFVEPLLLSISIIATREKWIIILVSIVFLPFDKIGKLEKRRQYTKNKYIFKNDFTGYINVKIT